MVVEIVRRHQERYELGVSKQGSLRRSDMQNPETSVGVPKFAERADKK